MANTRPRLDGVPHADQFVQRRVSLRHNSLVDLERDFAAWADRRDPVALARVFDGTAGRLLLLAVHLAGTGATAEDLVQSTFLSAMARASSWDRGRPVWPWLAAILQNEARMHWRNLRRRREVDLEDAADASATAPDPARLAASDEAFTAVLHAIEALPLPYRQVLRLRLLHGLRPIEIARALEVPVVTVRSQLHRGLQQLRAALPAGVALATAMLFVGDGPVLAQVRARVFAEVATSSAAAATPASLLLAGGWWTMHGKTVGFITAGAALLLCLGYLFDVPATLRPRGSSTVQSTPLVVDLGTDASAARTDLRAEPGRTEVPVPEVVAPSTVASLTVRLSWKGEGSPAVGLAVLCRRWTEPGELLVTDAVGEATLTDLEPGEYWIKTHDWYSEQVTLAAGEHVAVEHELERGRAVTGVVLGADGSPVIGATILISAGGTEPQWLFPAGHSDAQGRFACAGLRTYGLVGATHAQLGTSEFLLLRNEMGVVKAEDIVLRLPGTSLSVRGRVVDHQGRPVGGAWVQLGEYSGHMRQDDDDHLWQRAPATLRTTDADGRFSVSGLPPGDCPVLVYRQGFAPHREVVTLHAAMPELAVSLRPGGVLTGTVRDADGIAVVGAEVEQARNDFPARVSQETDSDGSFRFEDLPRGEMTVDVKTAGFPSQQRAFTFVGTELQTWEVVLQPGDAIRGRLVDQSGQPLVGWWVQTRGANRCAKTDDDGRFVIAEPTDSALVVRDQMGFVAERTRFEDVHPAPHEQSFVVPADSAPSAHLRGVCRDPDGSPLPDVELSLDQDRWPVLMENNSSAADGRFSVGPLPPGRYRLLPHHAQFAFPSLDVELRPDDRHELGDLTAVRPARLVVRLLGDEAACAGATVTLVAGVERVRSNTAEGRERTFVRVLPGRYRIVVLPSGGEVQDAGEVDLQPGADAARDVIVR